MDILTLKVSNYIYRHDLFYNKKAGLINATNNFLNMGWMENSFAVEFTTKEYSMMKENKDSYNHPVIHTFGFLQEKKCWTDKCGNKLIV